MRFYQLVELGTHTGFAIPKLVTRALRSPNGLTVSKIVVIQSSKRYKKLFPSHPTYEALQIYGQTDLSDVSHLSEMLARSVGTGRDYLGGLPIDVVGATTCYPIENILCSNRD